MLRISIAVVVAGVVSAIAVLATEPIAAIGPSGAQPALKGDRFHAPQNDACPFRAEAWSPSQQCPRNDRAPMQRRSEVLLASNDSRVMHDLGA